MLLSSLGVPKRGLISARNSSSRSSSEAPSTAGSKRSSSQSSSGSTDIINGAACGSPSPGSDEGSCAPELRIRREIRTESGSMRSACYVNGAATSLRVLRELGNALVDVNGQNSAQSLR